MAKCDVCGKTALIPEKFGAVNICKPCFMKVSGLLWKRQYDRREDAEKQRYKALDNAHKREFPKQAIAAINEFFMNQINSMRSCDCCSQYVQELHAFDKANICNRCFGLINVSAWNVIEYEENEDVEKNRKKVLKIASKNSFPQIVIDGINKHFDSKLQRGLICTIDGGKDQKLKVFDTYFVIITDDDFDIEKTSQEYGKVLQKSRPKESVITNSAARSLARGVLSGNVVMTGVKLATSAAINAAADKVAPEKGMFKVVKGKHQISYIECDYPDLQPCGDNGIGFIRFRNNRRTGDDTIFFFAHDSKKINEAYNAICDGISNARKPYTIPQTMTVQQIPSAPVTSVADEILKFKNLLDQGIITQEEFNAKKKELLRL